MLRFLDVDCPMARAIIAHDWSDSPVGRPETWPPALKTSVSLILGSHFPQCVVWGEHLVTIPNDAFLPILGNKPEALGQSFGVIWQEVWDDIGPMVDRALDGRATFIEDMKLTIERGGAPEEAWFTFCYSPIRDEFGTVCGMLDTVMETTGKVHAQRQGRVANHELAHRMKNGLAVVQAIARQTFSGDNATPDARKRFDGRITALAAAHDVLAQSSSSAADIAEVIRTALRPHLPSDTAVTLEGPPVMLSERRALSLSLAVHELATNAAKFGALSVATGHVAIRWEKGAGEDAPFRLEWQESGGPPVSPPSREGFGSRLITRILAADFAGEAELAYPSDGLRFELRAPMLNLG